MCANAVFFFVMDKTRRMSRCKETVMALYGQEAVAWSQCTAATYPPKENQEVAPSQFSFGG